MKLLFDHIMTEYWKHKLDSLKEQYEGLEILFFENEKEKKKYLKEADGLLGGFITEEELEIAENLKIIFVPFSGVNTLPSKKILDRNIIVANSKGNGKVVAERAVSLTMSLLGKIPHFHNDMRKGVWHGFSVGEKPNQSWESIINKQVTILGTGSIGRSLAKYLKAFDCEITGYKNSYNGEKIENFDILTTDFEKAIETAEIVYVALPLTNNTRDMVNLNNIELFKNKYLINVGRGPIINEEALYVGIKDGILKGTAIDVWYDYPTKENKYKLPSVYPIHLFENVILSPHVAGFNEKAVQYSIDWCIDNVINYIENGEPKNKVDMKLKY
ncbi:MAG: 2-hydroxyacid dehydrogenase [Thermotogota bacterium]